MFDDPITSLLKSAGGAINGNALTRRVRHRRLILLAAAAGVTWAAFYFYLRGKPIIN